MSLLVPLYMVSMPEPPMKLVLIGPAVQRIVVRPAIEEVVALVAE